MDPASRAPRHRAREFLAGSEGHDAKGRDDDGDGGALQDDGNPLPDPQMGPTIRRASAARSSPCGVGAQPRRLALIPQSPPPAGLPINRFRRGGDAKVVTMTMTRSEL